MGIEEIVEDWPMVKRRWEAWWECELVDRPLLQVWAPRAGVSPTNLPEVDLATWWTGPEFMVRRYLEEMRTTYCGGEALPLFWHGISVCHVLYFGCTPHFKKESVWVDPAPVAEDGYPAFDGWRESPWWQWMLEATQTVVEASQGRYFVMPVWGNQAGDNVGLARGTEQLMLDLALNPEWVKRAVRTVSDIQLEVYGVLWEMMAPEVVGVEGSVDSAHCWSPGRSMCFDCDISAMFSDEVFKKMFLPPLLETMHTVDLRSYHLDGTGALHHLDTLLALPELHAIQWIPGAGKTEIIQWIPLIQQIQEAGKAVQVLSSPGEVEPLLKEVRPEGLAIVISCDSEAEARGLVDRVSSLY